MQRLWSRRELGPWEEQEDSGGLGKSAAGGRGEQAQRVMELVEPCGQGLSQGVLTAARESEWRSDRHIPGMGSSLRPHTQSDNKSQTVRFMWDPLH